VPSERTHVGIADRFEAAAAHLQKNHYYDWELVTRFYAALHYVEARLARAKTHCRTHGDREQKIGDRRYALQAVYPEYSRLRDQSEAARYFGKQFSDSHLGPLRESYGHVRLHCRALLGLS